MGKKREKKRLNIFSYSDYREFLKDWCKTAQREKRHISYRWISEHAGFKSQSYFRLIVSGKRNLSNESLRKITAVLKLNKQESEYFQNLVGLNQSKTQEDKDYFYQRILGSQKYRKLRPLAKDQYEFYSKWYHPMIREIVNLEIFDGTPEWISMNIYPSISVDEAKASLSLLERLGFIEKKGKQWVQASAIISTGPEISSLLTMKYHQEVLRITMETFPYISRKVRDISVMNASCSWETLGVIKEKIQDFRKEIIKIVSMDRSTETGTLINIQMLPFIKHKL